MKRAPFIVLVVIGALFIGAKTYAAQTIVNTSENTQAGCGAGENTNCGARGASRNAHWQQLVDFSTFNNPNFTFNEVQVPMCIATGGTAQGTATSHMFLIRTEDQYNQAVADGLWSTHASSTSAESFISGSACGGASNTTTTTNNFGSSVTWTWASPVTISTSTPAYAFVWDQQIGGMAEVYTGVSKTIYHSQFSGNPFVSARLNNSNIAYNGNNMDYGMKIISDETELTFTYPTQNSTVNNDPLIITGTCQYGVELQLYNGITYASSTSAYGASRTCTSNSFSWVVSIDQGYWNLIADSPSNGAHKAEVFYFLAQSLTPTLNASTTAPLNDAQTVLTNLLSIPACPIPYISWDPCTTASNIITTLRNSVSNMFTSVYTSIFAQKPYSYVLQIKQSYDTMTHPTSTQVLDFTYNVYGTNVTFFNSSSTPRMLVSQSFWDTIRPYEELVIYGLMWLYLIHRFLPFLRHDHD